jgi:hypothetical protein
VVLLVSPLVRPLLLEPSIDGDDSEPLTLLSTLGDGSNGEDADANNDGLNQK